MQRSTVASLRAEMERLERELIRTRREWAAASREESAAFSCIVIEAQGHKAVLPSSTVFEVVFLVEHQPLPGGPPHVVGSIVYRGVPALLVDAGALVGPPRELPVSAHVVMLAATRLLALAVDRVVGVVHAPWVGETSSDEEGFAGTPLVSGFVRVEGEVLPVLRLEPLLEAAEPTARGPG